jgi:uncharacterized membrane protein
MKTYGIVWQIVLVILTGLLLSSAVVGQYQIIDLGDDRAVSINNNGQIVGGAIFDYWRAVLFDSSGDGNNIDLGTLGGYYSDAYCINNKGQIVGQGQSSTSSNYYQATLFDSTGSGGNINLGNSGSFLWSSAIAINDNGYIVGEAEIRDIGARAILFDSQGSGDYINLGTLGGNYSEARSINSKNEIVGYSNDVSRNQYATIFKQHKGENNINLGTIGGPNSCAYCINNKSQIVGGAAYNIANFCHAVLFDSSGNGANKDLGALDGYDSSDARFINNNGQIVGHSFNSGFRDWRATLFDPTGAGNNIDLNTLVPEHCGWMLEFAFSINDNGWIVGSGLNPAGEEHAYLLKPIPEPGSLLLIGIGAMLVRRQRRNTKNK